jgi:hypothetical protein
MCFSSPRSGTQAGNGNWVGGYAANAATVRILSPTRRLLQRRITFGNPTDRAEYDRA